MRVRVALRCQFVHGNLIGEPSGRLCVGLASLGTAEWSILMSVRRRHTFVLGRAAGCCRRTNSAGGQGKLTVGATSGKRYCAAASGGSEQVVKNNLSSGNSFAKPRSHTYIVLPIRPLHHFPLFQAAIAGQLECGRQLSTNRADFCLRETWICIIQRFHFMDQPLLGRPQ